MDKQQKEVLKEYNTQLRNLNKIISDWDLIPGGGKKGKSRKGSATVTDTGSWWIAFLGCSNDHDGYSGCGSGYSSLVILI